MYAGDVRAQIALKWRCGWLSRFSLFVANEKNMRTRRTRYATRTSLSLSLHPPTLTALNDALLGGPRGLIRLVLRLLLQPPLLPAPLQLLDEGTVRVPFTLTTPCTRRGVYSPLRTLSLLCFQASPRTSKHPTVYIVYIILNRHVYTSVDEPITFTRVG